VQQAPPEEMSIDLQHSVPQRTESCGWQQIDVQDFAQWPMDDDLT
jgi:hypothetical protein